jgi:hypothetical protein
MAKGQEIHSPVPNANCIMIQIALSKKFAEGHLEQGRFQEPDLELVG